MKRDNFFQAFCMTLTNPSREMQKWLHMDLQENMYAWKYGTKEVPLTA